MTFDRVTLFKLLRASFAPKAGLSAVQQTVVAAILDEWRRRGYSDLRWLAYMLATAWGECTWKPIAEIGKGKGRKYGVAVNGRVYYGRGLVQLTWHRNYEDMGKRLGLPLVENPDLALQIPVAVQIMFEGMVHGLFARDRNGPHSLARYFNETFYDPLGARRIINGADKKEAFARWYLIIFKALEETVRKPVAKTVEFEAPAPAPEMHPEEAASDGNPGKPEGKPAGGAGGAVAGGVAGGIATGGALATAGLPWTWIVLCGGVVAAALFIGLLAAKKEKTP